MLTHSASQLARHAIRQQLRAARHRLSPAERSMASQRAAKHLLAHSWYHKAQRIAVYTPVGSEADPELIRLAAAQDGKRVYRPSIPYRSGHLLFVRARDVDSQGLRRHGIPQDRPRHSRDWIRTRQLDLVVLPLLGFDAQGHRLGSGAGYYDRSFAFRLFTQGNKPRLVGLAYSCQAIDTLQPASWDVPLDAIVTEQGWIDPQKQVSP